MPTLGEAVSDLTHTVADKVSSAGSGLKEQLSGLSRASISSVKSLGRRCDRAARCTCSRSFAWICLPGLVFCRHSDDDEETAEELGTPRGSSVHSGEGDAAKASCLPISCLTSSKKLA